MTNTALLEKKIEESGFRREFIAKKLGLSAYGLAKKIKNETEFKASEIKGMCEILSITDSAEKELIFFAIK